MYSGYPYPSAYKGRFGESSVVVPLHESAKSAAAAAAALAFTTCQLLLSKPLNPEVILVPASLETVPISSNVSTALQLAGLGLTVGTVPRARYATHPNSILQKQAAIKPRVFNSSDKHLRCEEVARILKYPSPAALELQQVGGTRHNGRWNRTSRIRPQIRAQARRGR